MVGSFSASYEDTQTNGVAGGCGVKTPPPKFRSFDKAEPNSMFRGKHIRSNLIRI
jgi:hypothetical protein